MSMILRPASFTGTKLRESFLEGPKLAQWLTTSGAIGKVGDPCQLALRDAGKLTGNVLAITAREVSVSWNEIGGTLELKGFSMGPQRMVGIRIISWKLDSSRAKELEKQMEPAVERLAGLFSATAGQATNQEASQENLLKDKP
jgi:hypothetical protein